MLRLLAASVLALTACGGPGPKLKNLHCRTPSCQDVEDPFKVLLAVDFDDQTGTLQAGELELRVEGKTQTAVALKDLFNSQNIAAAAKTGTLNIDDDVVLSNVKEGQVFHVSLIAVNGQGHDSNEPSISFTVHLGGGGQ